MLELRKTVIEKTFTILFHKPHVKFHKMKQSKNLTEAKWRLGLKICEGRRAYGHAPAFSFTAQRVVAGISCGEQTWDAWPREDRFLEPVPYANLLSAAEHFCSPTWPFSNNLEGAEVLPGSVFKHQGRLEHETAHAHDKNGKSG